MPILNKYVSQYLLITLYLSLFPLSPVHLHFFLSVSLKETSPCCEDGDLLWGIADQKMTASRIHWASAAAVQARAHRTLGTHGFNEPRSATLIHHPSKH